VAYTVVRLVTLDCSRVIDTLSHCRQCGRHRQYECQRGINKQQLQHCRESFRVVDNFNTLPIQTISCNENSNQYLLKATKGKLQEI